MGEIRPAVAAPPFWEAPLASLDAGQWEALCDGCGKCCLHKLEDEDTSEIHFTDVTCRLFEAHSCRCGDYPGRKAKVPDCVALSPQNVGSLGWLPATCAYRLRFDNKPLPDWHYLISGDPETVHSQGHSVRGWTVSEAELPEDEWENYTIEDLS